jgi:tetratricopeptide (TPR) repeat protein
VPDLQPQAETPSAPQQPTNQPSLAELEQQVRNNPTDTGVVFGLAQRYRELQRNNDALAILQGAAARNPSDVALQQLYGDTLRDAGKFDEAVQAYQTAINADGSAGNYNKLGNELLKMKRLPQAIEALNKAINIDANAAEPHYHLGEVYEQQGNLTAALAEYRAYLLLANPDAPYYTEASDAVTRLQK